jgi:hypothetical protein
VIELGGPVVEVETAARGYVEHFGRCFAVDVVWAEAGELRALPAAPPHPPEPTTVLNVL